MKVLQIVESLNGQATESWLLDVLRLSAHRHPGIEWTFFCTVTQPGRMEDAAERHGARIVRSPVSVASTGKFVLSLRQVMKLGKYDVLHCHHDLMSALPLIASLGLPFKKRIVHVHNTSLSLPTPKTSKAALMRSPLRAICLRADRIVGVSQEALQAMLRGRERKIGRDLVIHCGIDTERFKRNEDAVGTLRTSFGFERNAKILLFVGRMIPYKNPRFLIEMLCHLDQRFSAVFVGSGPEEKEVRELARTKALTNRVRVLGWRCDVPQLMHASDALIWPGLEYPKEGLGLGVVEAQAAGLPVLMSRNVPDEAVVVPDIVKVLSLNLGASAWAAGLVELMGRVTVDRANAVDKVRASSFAIAQSTENIMRLYQSP